MTEPEAKISERRDEEEPELSVREFVCREILANEKITDEEIQKHWQATESARRLEISTIKRERTLFNKLCQYDQSSGLVDFFSSQASLLLDQYRNIEHLLGPPGSDWTWPGEHCETLLRDAIQRQLPPSLVAGKGYIHGVRRTVKGPERSPEIDILIYNQELFPPLFSMGHFVIVRPESVVAAIQIKRTLDPGTLAKAVENVVAAKRHVLETCQLNASVATERMYSAVVSFEEGVQSAGQANLSTSYSTAIKPHFSEFHHGNVLPDFVGSLTGCFLVFTGLNVQQMLYQAFPSVQDKRNVALPVLLFMLLKKIRPFGYGMLAAFPQRMPLIGNLMIWEKPQEAKTTSAEVPPKTIPAQR